MKHVFEVYHVYTRQNLIFSSEKKAKEEINNWKESVITQETDTICMLGIIKRILH